MSALLTPSQYQGNNEFAPQVTRSQGQPPGEVVDALEAGVSTIVRSMEIFESDGVTPWNPASDETTMRRLVSGGVNVDYNSSERRKLDIILDNTDGLLSTNPDGGFWYDKIIKVWKGIKYPVRSVSPPTAILEAPSISEGVRIQRIFSSLGFEKTDIHTASTTGIEAYEYYVSYTSTAATGLASELKTRFESGKRVVTISVGNTNVQLDFYTAGTARAARPWGIAPVSSDTPTKGSFAAETATPDAAGWGASAVSAWAVALATSGVGPNPTDITATLAVHSSGGMWLDIRLPNVNGPEAQKLLRAGLNYMRGYSPYRIWETQIGEFMIDGINSDRFPNQVKVTGRDYTKKMLQSKLRHNTTFVAGTKIRDIVYSVAINSGIPANKLRLDIGDEAVAADMSFDRGTDRWTIAKGACDAFTYELYFDGAGFLVARKFLDPYLSPVNWTFKTGSDGNLVTYDKSTNDSRIFNHIIVFADPASGDGLPFFGEAYNDDPDSPTNRNRIGDRVEPPFQANWLNSDEECQNFAVMRLKVAALESYDISFSSIYYPWLDGGEIVEILMPGRGEHEPTKFLLDTISYPLDLGPMSATSKRVTYVGNSGNP